MLVLDEADRLAEEGFMRDVRDILDVLPKQRRTGLFSATLDTLDSEKLKSFGLRNPVVIRLEKKANKKEIESSTLGELKSFVVPEKLTNEYLVFDTRVQKIKFLLELIKFRSEQKVLVFLNTCSSVEFYSKLFQHLLGSILAKNVFGLTGKMKQNKRSKIFDGFNSTKNGVLITTDVVGRGADFTGVELVVQVDPPQNPEYFVHRVGRTARAVNSGKALILLNKNEQDFLDYLCLKGLTLKHSDQVGKLGKIKDFLKKSKRAVLKDRDFHVKSLKGFVSFIRSYKEHRLKEVFRMRDVDLRDVAESFVLGRVPLIEETKVLLEGKSDLVIDKVFNEKLKNLEFKDPNQARQFVKKQETLLAKREKMEEVKKKKQRKAEKERKKKGHRKGRGFQERKRAKMRAFEEDFESFKEEEKLHKRLKQGKITEEEFDEIMQKRDRKEGIFDS